MNIRAAAPPDLDAHRRLRKPCPRERLPRAGPAPARPSGVFELTDGTGPGTVVRFTLDLQPTGFMKLMTPMITKQMRREVAQLETLKRVLEQAVPR